MLPPKHCNINLTGPIPRWDEAIPLGNGILGSLFWGPMEHLRISVDIAGLWLRRRPEEKLDKEFTYAKLVELARKGDVAETRRIFDTPYARPTPTKIPAGHLFLDGLPQGSYQASLDLGTAGASFSQNGTTILRAFLCMGRPVGVLMLPEAYRDATLTVERPSFREWYTSSRSREQRIPRQLAAAHPAGCYPRNRGWHDWLFPKGR